MRAPILNIIVIYLCILCAVFDNAVFAATQLRFGHINWNLTAADTTPSAVEFHVQLAFGISLGSVPSVGSLLYPGALDFGDGSSTQTISLVVSQVDTTLSIYYGTATIKHTYSTSASSYTAFYASGGRDASLKNNAKMYYKVSTVVNINQYVTNSKGVSVLNTSPVASILPLVTVYQSTTTTFRVTATDSQGQSLTYALASALEMGSASAVHPSQLSVAAATGIVTFNTNGVELGLWTTQIKISDGSAYVVVDFVINVITQPSVSPCLTSVTSNPYSLNSNVPFSLQLQTAMASGVLPDVVSSQISSGATLTSGVTGTSTFAWTPTAADVGTYIVTFGCRSASVVCPAACQSSIVLTVTNPCTYGTATASGCTCPTGYNPATNCSTCLAGYYGATCAACQCVYGTCNSGITGSGVCTCNTGYMGSTCNLPFTPCSSSSSSYVRSNSNTSSSVVNPTSATIYMSGGSLRYYLAVNFPTKPAKLDVMVVLDTSLTLSLSTLLNLQGAYASQFVTNVQTLSSDVYFGLATFANPTTCNANMAYTVNQALTQSSNDWLTALTLYAKPLSSVTCFSLNTGQQLPALTAAAGSASGWRAGAYRAVVFFTDTTYLEGTQYGSNYGAKSDVKTAFLANNVVPIIVTPSTVQSAYTTLTTAIGFGTTSTMQSSWLNAYPQAFAGLGAAIKSMWTVVQTDTLGFVTSVAASVTGITPPLSTTTYVNVKNPGVSYSATLSNIIVNIPGWSVVTIVPQIDSAPVPAVVSATTREDISVAIPVAASDFDSDSLVVVVETLPTKGTLYLSSSVLTTLTAGSSYTIPDGTSASNFYYTPNLHVSGSDTFKFYITDGCRSSSSFNAAITITAYNYPPVAVNVATSTNENVNLVITLLATDIEDASSALSTMITSLPDATKGSLYHINNNSLVQVNDILAASTSNTVRFVPVQYACCDTATFTYRARDTAPQFSDPATVFVYIVPVNQAPVASAYSPVLVDRGVSTAITFTVTDPDLYDTEHFKITSVGSVGVFKDASNNVISTMPYILSAVSTATLGTATQTIYFTGPANSMASSFVAFSVYDAAGVYSSVVNVSITVKTNKGPTTTSPGAITTPMIGNSTTFTLGGTDLDPADTSTLVVVLDQLPTLGTLVQVGGGDVTTLAGSYTNNAAFYLRGNTVYGSDQLTFHVVDVIGASSNVLVVPITWTPVNRPPVGSVPPLVTLQDTDLVSHIIVVDLDNDPVTCYITVLPAVGQLKQFDGTAITTVPTALTDTSYQFKFTPVALQSGNPYASFSFYLTDGKNASATVTASIAVTFVNYPPVSVSATTTLLQGASATSITLQATDIETPNAISATILTLPPTSAGALTDSLGNALAVGSIVAAPRTVKFTPLPLYYGTTSFMFSTNDGAQNSTNSATQTLVVTHVNHAPTTSNFYGTVVRTVPLTITIQGFDIDVGDTLTITISAYAGLGTFTLPSSAAFLAAPFNLPTTLTVPVAGVASTTFTYTAPITASGNNYANFSYVVTDQGGLHSATTTVTIDIPADQSPVAATLTTVNAVQDVATSSFTLSGTDPDVADNSILNVIISTLPAKGTLSFLNGTTITSTGTIATTSSVSLTYLTTQRGSDQFMYSVQDPLGSSSSPVTVSISITNTNHPPVVSWIGTCIGNEDTIIAVSQMSASDPDSGDTVSFYIAEPPNKGVLSQSTGALCSNYPCLVSASNTMRFTPPANDNGVPYTSFVFYAMDNHGVRSLTNATGVITVTPVDDPPIATNTTATGLENSDITVLLNVVDIDTPVASLTITIVGLPPTTLGVLVDLAGVTLNVGDVRTLQSLKFVPALYANGDAIILYRASDLTSTVGPAAIHVVVTPVTQPPTCSVALPSPIFVAKLTSTSIGLITNDPDSGETYTYYLLSLATNGGVLSGPDGAITASTSVIATIAPPSSNTFVSTAYVTYNVTFVVTSMNVTFLVNDGTYNSTPCSLDIIVTGNQAPVPIAPSPVTTLEESMSSLIVLNGTDVDDSWATATVGIVSLPTHGTLYNGVVPVSATGNLPQGVFGVTYMPNPLFHSTDAFSFIITDQTGVHSAVESVSITVTHVNHPPTYVAGIMTTLEDVPLNISILVADVDVGDVPMLVLASGPSQGVFVSLAGTTLTYPASIASPFKFTFIPAQYSNGPFTFTFYATDSVANTGTATGTISVVAVNNAPVASNLNVALQENDPAYTFSMSMTDVDNTQAQLSGCIATLPPTALGTVTLPNGNAVTTGTCVSNPRTLVFTPAQYAHGVGVMTFFAKDLALYSVAPGSVTFTITHVNHAPTVTAATPVVATRSVQLSINLVASDVDVGDDVSIVLLDVTGGAVSNISSGSSIALNDIFFSGTISVFGATLSPVLYYTAPALASGANYANFTFVAVDQVGAASAPFSVLVSIAANNAPTANSASIATTQETFSSPITLSGADVDVADSGSLTLTITALPTKGYLIMNANNITTVPTVVTGAITYYTALRGSDGFYFTVTDPLGLTSAATLVPITITPVNHPPTISFTGAGISVLETNNITITLISASDPDADHVTITISAIPANGTLHQMDGTPITSANTAITDSQYRLVFVPVPVLADLSTSFSIVGNDGMNAVNSITATLTPTITIVHVNRPPVAYPSLAVNSYAPPNFTATANVTDLDTPIAQVSIVIQAIPDPAVAVVTDLNGVPITTGQVVPYPFTLMVAPNSTGVGSTSFMFYATDGLDISSVVAYRIIINSAVNSAPVAISTSSFTAVHGVPLSIPLSVHDNDYNELFTYSVSAQMSGSGSLVDASTSLPLSPPTFALTVLQDPVLYVSSAVVIFTAPLTTPGQSNYLMLNYSVADRIGAVSNEVSVQIDIAPNNAPVAVFSGSVSLLEEGDSSTFNLNGVDSDAMDTANLRVVLVTLPAKGTLMLVGSGPVNSIGTYYRTTDSFFIRGSALQHGADSFSYQVLDGLNAHSAPVVVSISITHVNHPPTALVVNLLPVQAVMNLPSLVTLLGQDPDNDPTLTMYITDLPNGQLTQLDGTVFTGATPTNPIAVTSVPPKVYFVPPTNAYGANFTSFTFFVADNSGAANNLSAPFTAYIDLARVDLPPTGVSTSFAAPDVGNTSFALLGVDPQAYAMTATVVVFPTSGSLIRADGTAITPSAPTVAANQNLTFMGVKGTYGQTITVSYQVTSATSGLTSNTYTVSMVIYRVYDAPVFTGQTSYSVPDFAQANMLLSGSSETGSYSVKVLSFSAGSWLFVDGGIKTPITSAPFTMSNSIMENRVKFTPAGTGNSMTYIEVQVIDAYGVSAPVNISVSVYHTNVPPTIVSVMIDTAGVSYNWTIATNSSDIVPLSDNQCAAVSWEIVDPDSLAANLSSMVMSLPDRGTLLRFLPSGAAGQALVVYDLILADGNGEYFAYYCPETGASFSTNFSITALDDFSVAVNPLFVPLVVVAPGSSQFTNVTTAAWNATTLLPMIITGASVGIIGDGSISSKLIVTLTYFDATNVAFVPQRMSAISFPNYNASVCSAFDFNVTCVAPINSLNAMIDQLNFTAPALSGVYYIEFYIFYLSNAKRSSDPTNATYVTIVHVRDAPTPPPAAAVATSTTTTTTTTATTTTTSTTSTTTTTATSTTDQSTTTTAATLAAATASAATTTTSDSTTTTAATSTTDQSTTTTTAAAAIATTTTSTTDPSTTSTTSTTTTTTSTTDQSTTTTTAAIAATAATTTTSDSTTTIATTSTTDQSTTTTSASNAATTSTSDSTSTTTAAATATTDQSTTTIATSTSDSTTATTTTATSTTDQSTTTTTGIAASVATTTTDSTTATFAAATSDSTTTTASVVATSTSDATTAAISTTTTSTASGATIASTSDSTTAAATTDQSTTVAAATTSSHTSIAAASGPSTTSTGHSTTTTTTPATAGSTASTATGVTATSGVSANAATITTSTTSDSSSSATVASATSGVSSTVATASTISETTTASTVASSSGAASTSSLDSSTSDVTTSAEASTTDPTPYSTATSAVVTSSVVSTANVASSASSSVSSTASASTTSSAAGTSGAVPTNSPVTTASPATASAASTTASATTSQQPTDDPTASQTTTSKSAQNANNGTSSTSALSTRSKNVLIATVASSGVLVATTAMLYAYNFMKRRVHQQEFAIAWKAVSTHGDEDDDGPDHDVSEAWSETDTLNSEFTPRSEV